MKKLKKIWISLALTLSPILMYEALSMAKYWQSEKIEVTGYQIAKRVNPTRNGDRFSVLLDTEYGVMEIPVSYATYITSSNNCKHSWKIKLLTAYNGLDNTSKLREAYPFLQHDTLNCLIWVLAIVVGLASFLGTILWVPEDIWDKVFVYGWFLVNGLGAVLGLIL